MLFRIALSCGEWNVYRLAEDMPSSLFDKWKAFHDYEPFGAEWENWLMARQSHLFAQAHTQRHKTPDFSSFFYKGEIARAEERQAKTCELIDFFDRRVDG